MPRISVPQYIYLAAVACYLFFFLLFCRFFLWKRYAEQYHWRRCPPLSVAGVQTLARRLGRELPYCSIVVPARNEADVIQRTVEHLRSLQYPAAAFEVVVVSDEKEAQASNALRPQVVQAATVLLHGGRPGGTLGEQAQGLVLGLLARLALAGWEAVRCRYGGSMSEAILRRLPAPGQRSLVREAAALLLERGGRGATTPLLRLLRRRLAVEGEAETAAYAALLSLAIPTVLALANLVGQPSRRSLARLVAQAARTHQALTREILWSMSEALAADILARLAAQVAAPDLKDQLTALYREVYPTTQDILEDQLAASVGGSGPRLKHVQVPSDFDGRVGGECVGRPVPSTKGRALNWALSFLDARSRWCGFYDAESRPDPRVLLYIARRDLEGSPARLYQGPVFQVRNFYEMSPFCKIASLYQSLAHDWYLPALFRRLPFVGGTNLFVRTDLVRQLGGYDPTSLTEDLELGTRAHLAAGAWPEYLPLASSEQTPPTFKSFYRQRLRWATGHLQVMDKVRRSTEFPLERRQALLRQLLRKGQMEWLLYQGATLVPPLALLLWWVGWLDPEVLPNAARWGLNVLSLIYLVFTIYAFFRYSRFLDATARPRAWLGRVGVVSQLLCLPLAAFLFPVPYSSALVLRSVGRAPDTWVKTPRTRE